jgi:hypothetical protein
MGMSMGMGVTGSIFEIYRGMDVFFGSIQDFLGCFFSRVFVRMSIRVRVQSASLRVLSPSYSYVPVLNASYVHNSL